jgi:transposase
MRRHELTDEQWIRIQPLIPTGLGRPPVLSSRTVINAVFWTAKPGAPWRDLPIRFGSWKTVYNRFRNWANRDIWLDIFRAVTLNDDEVGGMLDASIVRAHQDAAGGRGGSKKTK